MNRLVQSMDNLAFCLTDKITKWHAIGAAVIAVIGFNLGYIMCLLA